MISSWSPDSRKSRSGHLRRPGQPRAAPRLIVDEPVLKMTFGVNTSPLSGRDGKFLTSRQIQDRLNEVLGTSPSASSHLVPEVVEVAGQAAAARRPHRVDAPRGLRTAGEQAEVVIREIEGKPHEPVERAVVDVPTSMSGRSPRRPHPGREPSWSSPPATPVDRSSPSSLPPGASSVSAHCS